VPLNRDTALQLLSRLHARKNAGYGVAWRKRGEVLSIFTNLARKYDRLVVSLDQEATSADERLLDTAGDLCIYSAKYLTWLAEQAPEAFNAASKLCASDCADKGGTDALDLVLQALRPPLGSVGQYWVAVKAAFEPLEVGLIAQSEGEEVFDWERKVELTWDLAAASAGLLIALGQENADEVASWQAEIEAMG
jgi:hypothetical protein